MSNGDVIETRWAHKDTPPVRQARHASTSRKFRLVGEVNTGNQLRRTPHNAGSMAFLSDMDPGEASQEQTILNGAGKLNVSEFTLDLSFFAPSRDQGSGW